MSDPTTETPPAPQIIEESEVNLDAPESLADLDPDTRAAMAAMTGEELVEKIADSKEEPSGEAPGSIEAAIAKDLEGGAVADPADAEIQESIQEGRHGFARLRAQETLLREREASVTSSEELAKSNRELKDLFAQDPVAGYHKFLELMGGADNLEGSKTELYEALTLQYAGVEADSDSRTLRETRKLTSEVKELLNAKRDSEHQQSQKSLEAEHTQAVTRACENINTMLTTEAKDGGLQGMFPNLMAEDDPSAIIFNVCTEAFERSGRKRELTIEQAAKLAEPVFKRQNDERAKRLGWGPQTSLAEPGKQGDSVTTATTRKPPKPSVTNAAASEASTLDDVSFIEDNDESEARSLRMLKELFS